MPQNPALLITQMQHKTIETLSSELAGGMVWLTSPTQHQPLLIWKTIRIQQQIRKCLTRHVCARTAGWQASPVTVISKDRSSLKRAKMALMKHKPDINSNNNSFFPRLSLSSLPCVPRRQTWSKDNQLHYYQLSRSCKIYQSNLASNRLEQGRVPKDTCIPCIPPYSRRVSHGSRVLVLLGFVSFFSLSLPPPR